MKAIRLGGVLLLMALCGAGATGDNAGLGDFKTLAARNAADTYAATLLRLGKDYKEKTDAARKVCISQLTAAQQSATKAGNLDEAILIRNAVTKLTAETAESAPGAKVGGAGMVAEREKLSQALGNSVWQSADAKLKFNDDGTGTYAGAANPASWQWVALNGHEIYIQFNNGWTVKILFDETVKTFTYLDCGNGTRREAQSGKRVQ